MNNNKAYFSEKILSSLVQSYPYKHFVIEDFLQEADVLSLRKDLSILESTKPTNLYSSKFGEKKEWRTFKGDYEFLETFMGILASQEVISALKTVMGIDSSVEVFPDSSYDGGGYVISPPGAHLGYHADFNFSSDAGSYRVMNVLYYFNENYQENLGGVLHLLDSETKTVEKMVYPRRNTLLCFLTDDLSFHGVSINNENFFRRSFNIYFYTRTPLNSSQSFQPHKTLWISEVEKHDH